MAGKASKAGAVRHGHRVTRDKTTGQVKAVAVTNGKPKGGLFGKAVDAALKKAGK